MRTKMLLLVLVGCGGNVITHGSPQGADAAAEPPAPVVMPPMPATCVARHAQYLLTKTPTSGTCLSYQMTGITPIDDNRAVYYPDGCTSSVVPSPDNCTVTTTLDCPSYRDDGSRTATKETITWSPDAVDGHGIGTATTTTPDGTMVCTSTYNLDYHNNAAPVR